MFNEEKCYQDNCFQLPIEFLNDKQKLSPNLINDLEGKHIIFIQPDLKSFKSSDKKLNY